MVDKIRWNSRELVVFATFFQAFLRGVTSGSTLSIEFCTSLMLGLLQVSFAGKMDFNNLEHYFKYHPVASDSRKIAHHAINEAALKFAKTVLAQVQDEECRKMAFFAIQQARTFANQGATMDELKLQSMANGDEE
jgi:hypothetical protein